MANRSDRNKTLLLNEQELLAYYAKCLPAEKLNEQANICNQIIHGDMQKVAQHLPVASVDILIADPPYNMQKEFHGNSFRKMDDDAYYAYTENWLLAIKHTLKKTASIYVCCDWRSSMVIGTVLKKHFCLQNRITWQREKGRGANKNWKNGMEDIWFATVAKEYTFNVEAVKIKRRVLAPYRLAGKPKDWEETAEGNFRMTYPSNFWDDLSIPYWSMAENTPHPTQKPEKLVAKLILASSNAGDMVLDPFLGSGTTAVVAKKLGRNYLGIEMNQEYCAWSAKRIELVAENSLIQGYASGVFWERNSLKAQKRSKRDEQ
ncbi:MAG: DNA methyltransferase [Clostridia bacterium]